MFTNRQAAGRQLAEHLLNYRGLRPLVLGLPRGGVVVAAPIAEALGAELDVLVVRKLPAPRQPELALGAVTDGDEPRTILNEPVIRALRVTRDHLDREIALQLDEVRKRQALYRGGRSAATWRGRLVIVVDDGIATGASVRAGIQALRAGGANTIVLAVPVAPPDAVRALRGEVDDLVCLHSPEHFAAVGAFYEDFSQTTDEEVIEMLKKAEIRKS